jgi:hypothetical protein
MVYDVAGTSGNEMVVSFKMDGQAKTAPPHALALQYAVEIVLSHSSNRRVTQLHCESRWPMADTALAGSGTIHSGPRTAELIGVAAFGTQVHWPEYASVVAAFGTTKALAHAKRAAPRNWKVADEYCLYTHVAKFFGGVMRVGGLLNLPALEDWALFGVRRHYGSAQPRASTYRVIIWERVANRK